MLRKVGVLALQGDFLEHLQVLERLKFQGRPVRLPRDLEGLEGVIIPGGESTVMARMLEDFGLLEPLRAKAREGMAVLGTCAGLILLAKKSSDLPLGSLGLMDLEVRRNGYGRQVDSFETEVSMPALGEAAFPGVFIRAPIIEKVGPGVEVLATLPSAGPVAVRQGNLLGASFHPELTRDLRFHAYFLNNLS